MDLLTYKRILAIAVTAVVIWIVIILYRVSREEVIKKVDFWRAKWKIVLFWMVVVLLLCLIWYVLYRLGIINPK